MINNKRFMHGRRGYDKKDPRDVINIQTGKASFGNGFAIKIAKDSKI